MAPKRRPNSFSEAIDSKEALETAVNFELSPDIFPPGQLNTYVQAKAKKLGVLPTMILPSLLSSVASAMNNSQFQLTDTWTISPNLFILCIANKGAGKTPAGRVFLEPLLEMEKDEKMMKVGHRQTVDHDGEDEEDTTSNKADERNFKRGRYSDDMTDKGDDYEAKMFKSGQRIVDTITPEALFLALFYGNGNLLMKADEFKGLYDKFIVGAQNISALCSAFSGEPINYTTVKRGPLTIYESRLGIFGSIQPALLVEIINGSGGGAATNSDHQGLFDRFIYIASSEDHRVEFEDQLKDLEENDKFDVFSFLKKINEVHSIPRTYHCSQGGLEEVKGIKKELKKIDKISNFGNETCGMTAKAFTNVLKLAPVYACTRQTLCLLTDDNEAAQMDYLVTDTDIKAAWSVIKFSMHCFQTFKVAIREELQQETTEDKSLSEEETDDNIIMSGLTKIVKMYSKSRDNKILMSVVRRDSLYPKINGLGLDDFIKVLEKYGIGITSKEKTGNKVSAEMLVLTSESEDPEVLRVFEIMYERAKTMGLKFDPLKKFEKTE